MIDKLVGRIASAGTAHRCQNLQKSGGGVFWPLHRPAKRAAAIVLSVCMVFTAMPTAVFAVEAGTETGLCDHHRVHTVECGYQEAKPGHPCEHTHAEDCYTGDFICGYIEDEDATASDSNAGHKHTQDCRALDCPHENGVHDEDCRYIEDMDGIPCGNVCSECGGPDKDGGKKPEPIPPEGVEDIVLTGFDDLDIAVQYQSVPAGTKLDDLPLPAELDASGYKGSDAETAPEPVTVKNVVWEPDTPWDEKAEQGSYIFIPVLPVGYTLADGVELPEIYVKVGERPVLYESAEDYNADDVAAFKAILEAHPSLKEISGVDENNPASWQTANLVYWDKSPKRIVGLYLINKNLSGTLNVSGLSALDTLKCYTNKLEALGVNGLTSLRHLECPENKLKTLDVSGLTGLKYLHCANNNLETLNMSGLTGLESVHCDNNLLRTLDISNLTNLSSIICGNNPITTLKVADNAQLTVQSVADGKVMLDAYKHETKSVTLVASPNKGCFFRRWTANGIELANATASWVKFELTGKVTLTPVFENPQAVADAQAVAAAKTAIEGGIYTVLQENAGTEDDLKTALAQQINTLDGMRGTDITVAVGNITIASFNPATAGDGDNVDGVEGSFTFTVSLTKGATTDITSSKDGIITATVFNGQSNAQAVAAAKTAIEGGVYTVAQADAGTEDDLKASLSQQINDLEGVSGAGITVAVDNITIASFNPATAGDGDNVDGVDGSFSFTVSLTKGATTVTTSSKDGIITATVFIGQSNADAVAEAKTAIEGGVYTVAQADAGTADDLKAALSQQINDLEGVSGAGITVTDDNITVVSFNSATAGDGDNVDGVDGRFTFTVSLTKGATTVTTSSKDGIITAEVFTGQSNADAVAEAKTVIEGGVYTVAQADAGTADDLKAALSQQINDLEGVSGAGITVTDDNITIGLLNPATAGDGDNVDGVDGSFTFTVSLTKGATTVTTSSKDGIITAEVFTGQSNADAVAEAKTAIEGNVYTVDQADAGTKDDLKASLSQQINDLEGVSGAGITVTVDNITVVSFDPATAGDGDNVDGVDGSFTFTVSVTKGATTDTTSGKDGIITATVFNGQSNADAVAAAKTAIEGGIYTVAQADAGTEDDLKASLSQQINDLEGVSGAGITVTVDNITVVSFDPATAGDGDNVDGVDGSFTFTVSVTKGATTDTTSGKDGIITAKVFTGQSNADAVAAAKAAIEGGVYTVAQADAGTEAALKASLSQQINDLEGVSGAGITVAIDNITIASFNPATAGDGDDVHGVDGSFTFTVSVTKGATTDTTDSKDGIITATVFIGQTNADAVAAAKTAIEGGIYTVTQETANSENAVKSWLAAAINSLADMQETGITVTAENIRFDDFTKASAGDADTPKGTDGRFVFSVALTKGRASATASREGAVIATEYIYTITASAGAGGTISPGGQVTAKEGESRIFNITPDRNYAVSQVIVDGENKGTETTYTFENITKDHSISVTFRYTGGGGGGGGGNTGSTSTTGAGSTTPTTSTTTAATGDGGSVTTTTATTTDSSGKKTTVTTEVVKDASGNVTGSTATVITDNVQTTAGEGVSNVTVKPDAAAINSAAMAAGTDGTTAGNLPDVLVDIPADVIAGELAKPEVGSVAVDVIIPTAAAGKQNVAGVTIGKGTIQAAKDAGKGVAVTIRNEDGSLEAVWSLDGAAMGNTGSEVTDVSLGLHTTSIRSEDPSAQAVKPLAAAHGNENGLVLNISGSGKLTAPTKLTVPITGQTGLKAGDQVVLYRHDPAAGVLVPVPGGSYTVDANGKVTIDLPAKDFAAGPDRYVLLPVPAAGAVPPAVVAPAGATTPYEIKRGDTLNKIARQHGCTVQELLDLNQIPDVTDLRIGQVIQLPAR